MLNIKEAQFSIKIALFHTEGESTLTNITFPTYFPPCSLILFISPYFYINPQLPSVQCSPHSLETLGNEVEVQLHSSKLGASPTYSWQDFSGAQRELDPKPSLLHHHAAQRERKTSTMAAVRTPQLERVKNTWGNGSKRMNTYTHATE